jgi:enoyl-CoA hydratase/carnithine racemase
VASLATRLAEGPTGAIARMKRLVNRAVGMDALDEHLGAEVDALVESADSQEFTLGLERFFDRSGRTD